MAQTLAELYVKISSDFQKVDGDLSKLDHRIKGMDPSIQKMESGFSKVNKTIGALGGVIAGIGIVKFGSDIIGASTRIDSLNRSLITTEGSASKASARMKEFVQIAKDPGLGLTQLAKGYIQLKSVGIGADLAIRSIRGIANAIALVGGGKEELERVTRQFVQMQGKGKVMAEDLMVIAESMPQIRKMAELAFPAAAKSSKGLTEALQEMGVTGKQFIAGVTAEMEKMPKAADSAKNAQDNFTDSLERFRAKLGDQILPAVTDFLNKLTDLMSKFEAMPASTQKLLGQAVVGGAGLLGIAATLTSIVSTIGLVKTGLGGLGAVNIASAGASVASSAVASGLVNQYGRPISSAVTSGAGAAAGASLLTKAGVVTVFIAGAAGAFWAGSKVGEAIFGKPQYDKKGNFITNEKPLSEDELKKWGSAVDKFNTSYFGTTDKSAGVTTRKTIPASESVMAKLTESQLEELHKEMPNIPYKSKEEIKKDAAEAKKEAEKASEIYWTNWFDHAEAGAKQGYQVVLENKTPNISLLELTGVKPHQAQYRDQPISPSMAGGVPAISGLDISRAGLTSGLGFVSKASQEREKSLNKIYDIEKKVDAELEKSVLKFSSGAKWSFADMSDGIEKVGSKWDSFAMDMYSSIGGMTNMSSTLLSLIQGYQNIQEKKRKWKETEMQLESRVSRGEISNEEAFWTQLSTSGFTRDIAFKKLHDMGVEGYASGGWIMKPTIALMGEREPELVIPKSKMGSSGLGGNTHIEIHAINVPTMDRQAAENLVINAINDARRHARI